MKEHVKLVYVCTNGCPENRIDGARMLEFLKSCGFDVAEDFRQADLCVFNACGLTNSAEEQSLSIIKRIQRGKSVRSRFLVCGCLPRINLNRLREVYEGPVFGSDEIYELGKILNLPIVPTSLHANSPLPVYRGELKDRLRDRLDYPSCLRSPLNTAHILLESLVARRLAHRFDALRPGSYAIKASTGCLNSCAYCAVKLSRGNVKSKPIGDILQEFKEGLSKGAKVFSILGTDLGSYGRDRGDNLVSLLTAVLEIEGEYKLRLRNIHPRSLMEMLPDLKTLFQTGKVEFFNSALQSGSDRILKLMKRGHSVADVKDSILTLRKAFPNITIASQVIVAFPGETREDFKETLRTLSELKFDFVEVYQFSPRPNTVAANLPGAVQHREALRRHRQALMSGLFSPHYFHED